MDDTFESDDSEESGTEPCYPGEQQDRKDDQTLGPDQLHTVILEKVVSSWLGNVIFETRFVRSKVVGEIKQNRVCKVPYNSRYSVPSPLDILLNNLNNRGKMILLSPFIHVIQ